tara:strand:+ start:345 stop:524 length:180 start_codon:yes stop_codon:yes gene_type:complete
MIDEKKIRSSLASCIIQLSTEHKEADVDDVCYDLGYIRALCYALDKTSLAEWLSVRLEL